MSDVKGTLYEMFQGLREEGSSNYFIGIFGNRNTDDLSGRYVNNVTEEEMCVAAALIADNMQDLEILEILIESLVEELERRKRGTSQNTVPRLAHHLKLIVDND